MDAGKTYKSGTVTVNVDYGYDTHSITFSGRTYSRVLAGQSLIIKGQGFHWDGLQDQDTWHFNENAPGSVSIDTDSGADIFKGNLSDGEVWVDIDE